LKPKLAILPDGRLVAQNSSFLGLHTASLDKGCNRPGPDAGWFSAKNLVPILSRAGTADPAEYPREVLLRFETVRHGDIKNPHLGLAQHLLFTLRQPFTVPNENSMWRTDWSSMRTVRWAV